MPSPRVLVVEDEPNIRELVCLHLGLEGYTCDGLGDGREALNRAETDRYDLLVLDVMIPGVDGLALCRAVRNGRTNHDVPILMLTARREESDKVVGLESGADDYLTKPFEMIELLARVEALLRRAPATPSPQSESYQFGPVKIDFRRAEVERDGQKIELSAKEFQLIRYFVEHREATLSRDELLNEVWGYDAMPTTRTVDVHVAWLRQKLEPNPRHPQFILTIHGMGYKFVG